MGRKRKLHNSELTNGQRKMICLHKDATAITNKELSLWATETFAFPVSEMTISRTLKRRDKWFSDTAVPEGKRDRKLLCPEVEDATYAWFLAMQDKGGRLTDALICEAAKRFYASLDHVSTAKPLVFSNGWLGRFKKRHGIKGHLTNGERQLVHTSEEAQHQIDAVKSIIADYEPGDVFHMEDTGLLFALQPFKTLATKRISSTRILYERIAVGFTANLDGSTKLPPLVINKCTRPQAFISRNILNPSNLGILWYANYLARITTEIFEKYVLDFEKRMLLAGKSKVLLLINTEYSKHFANVEKNLKITVVKFLPNTSGLYRYEDAGVISFVKASYRKHLLKHQIDCILSGKDSNVDIYDAVVYLEKSWRVDVTQTVISNGFRQMYLYRAKTPPFDNPISLPDASGSLPRRSFELNEQLTKVSELLEQLRVYSSSHEILPDMSADEYVHFEEHNGFATFREPRDDEIWEASRTVVQKEEAVVPVGVDSRLTYSTVQASLQGIETYLLQQQEDTVEMLQSLRALGENLANHHAKLGRQRDIARLFICDERIS